MNLPHFSLAVVWGRGVLWSGFVSFPSCLVFVIATFFPCSFVLLHLIYVFFFLHRLRINSIYSLAAHLHSTPEVEITFYFSSDSIGGSLILYAFQNKVR